MFSEAIISFSIGGRHFQDEPIRYTYVEDSIFESSRNVSIKLHHRIGKWVRIELRFAASWILISEVVFDSGELFFTSKIRRLSLADFGWFSLETSGPYEMFFNWLGSFAQFLLGGTIVLVALGYYRQASLLPSRESSLFCHFIS